MKRSFQPIPIYYELFINFHPPSSSFYRFSIVFNLPHIFCNSCASGTFFLDSSHVRCNSNNNWDVDFDDDLLLFENIILFYSIYHILLIYPNSLILLNIHYMLMVFVVMILMHFLLIDGHHLLMDHWR